MEDRNNTQISDRKVALKSPENSDLSFGAGVVFLAGVTFASVLGGLGLTLGRARRRNPGAFGKQHEADEATRLALRALAWGTVYAVGGVGLLVFSVKSALGVKNAKEFGEKMKSILPTQDGKLVTYFESWRLPRNRGKPDHSAGQWFSDGKPLGGLAREDSSGEET